MSQEGKQSKVTNMRQMNSKRYNSSSYFVNDTNLSQPEEAKKVNDSGDLDIEFQMTEE